MHTPENTPTPHVEPSGALPGLSAEQALKNELPATEVARIPNLSPEAEDISRALMASEDKFPAAISQIKTDPGAFEANAAKIIAEAKAAEEAGAEMIVFPELTITGYAHMDLAFRSGFAERSRETLEEVAKQIGNITAVVGFIDTEPGEVGPGGNPILYNSAAVIRNGEIVAIRDKTLLPEYDIFSEKRYFSPGKRTGIVEVAGRKIGIGICEDMWQEGYSTEVYPKLLEQNPDALINLSASPFHEGKVQNRTAVIENLLGDKDVPFIYANLVGSYDGYDGEVVFDGRSMVFSKGGELSAIGNGFREDMVLCDIAQPGTLPIPQMDSLGELHDALILGIQDYFRRSGFEKAYIGLSGGIDSALVAALCVEALGAENVIGVTMPSHITSDETKDDAYELAENLGITIYERPIGPEYNAWHEGFVSSAGHEPESLTKQNKQARIRGSILMEYTNEDRKGLVVSTGNKTELALGYCTLYGDMCGGFAAISDVNKLKVYALSSYINQKAGREVIPETTIERPPTAELEEGQTDANSLPADYDVLSPLVDDIVDRQLSKAELYKSYRPDVVDKIVRMIDIQEYKRRQAAPGIRVTPKAFGIGRRMPMSHGYVESAA